MPPDDPEAFVTALREMVADPTALDAMGEAGRTWVEQAASPAAVARAYHDLIAGLASDPSR